MFALSGEQAAGVALVVERLAGVSLKAVTVGFVERDGTPLVSLTVPRPEDFYAVAGELGLQEAPVCRIEQATAFMAYGSLAGVQVSVFCFLPDQVQAVA